jgi:hypothetical protein
MAARSKMAYFLTSYFQKFGKNQWIIFFPFFKLIFIKQYSFFLEKFKGWRKIQNGGQNPRWRRVDFFQTEIQLRRQRPAFWQFFFWCKSVDNKLFYLKQPTRILEFDKLAEKFTMASETYLFVSLLSKLHFSTVFKNIDWLLSKLL